eukprot:9744313-Lingulodinium_polyedra.AAC.1
MTRTLQTVYGAAPTRRATYTAPWTINITPRATHEMDCAQQGTCPKCTTRIRRAQHGWHKIQMDNARTARAKPQKQ